MSSATALNLDWSKILSCGKELTLPQTSPGFYVSALKIFRNIVGKGEIAHNEQFFPFPPFSILLNNFLPFSSTLKLSSANSFSLEESKICGLGKSKSVCTLKGGKLKDLSKMNVLADATCA